MKILRIIVRIFCTMAIFVLFGAIMIWVESGFRFGTDASISFLVFLVSSIVVFLVAEKDMASYLEITSKSFLWVIGGFVFSIGWSLQISKEFTFIVVVPQCMLVLYMLIEIRLNKIYLSQESIATNRVC